MARICPEGPRLCRDRFRAFCKRCGWRPFQLRFGVFERSKTFGNFTKVRAEDFPRLDWTVVFRSLNERLP